MAISKTRHGAPKSQKKLEDFSTVEEEATVPTAAGGSFSCSTTTSIKSDLQKKLPPGIISGMVKEHVLGYEPNWSSQSADIFSLTHLCHLNS